MVIVLLMGFSLLSCYVIVVVLFLFEVEWYFNVVWYWLVIVLCGLEVLMVYGVGGCVVKVL